MLLFWYGVLHAFGPDHLTVIANFSIGQELKKALFVVIGFALGHGMMLFIFASVLSQSDLPFWLLAYADTIAALIILMMGLYLLYKLYSGSILLKRHKHGETAHTHITFDTSHKHDKAPSRIGMVVFLGSLMGIGGLRGMLITLGALSQTAVTPWMVLLFIFGVMTVFLTFGLIILYINKSVLHSQRHVEQGFKAAGFTSIGVAVYMLSAS